MSDLAGKWQSFRRGLLRPVDLVRELLFIFVGLTIGAFANVGPVALAVAGAVATVIVSWSFFRIGESLQETQQEISDELRDQLKQATDDARETSVRLAYELRNQVKSDISKAHATVYFVDEDSNDPDEEHAYLAAKDAVNKAQHEILVVSDYSPPAGTGATLGDVPVRSDYLDHILAIVQERAQELSNAGGSGRFRYVRVIQRPQRLYEHVRRQHSRDNRVTLLRDHMVGDQAVFEHVRSYFELRDKTPTVRGRVDHSIHFAPVLPNCPSMLIVDGLTVQFTIPGRSLNQTQSEYGAQQLQGVLVLEDRRNGDEIATHFRRLVEDLTRFSIPVVGVSDETDPTIDPRTGMPASRTGAA